MNTYNTMTKIHVWAGITSQNKHDFTRYFEINHADRDTGIGASQFDKDIHIKWYDDDLIGVYYSSETELDTALDELPTSQNSLTSIREKCLELGVTEANALFYYEDAELSITEPNKKYNELTYIGVFDN